MLNYDDDDDDDDDGDDDDDDDDDDDVDDDDGGGGAAADSADDTAAAVVADADYDDYDMINLHDLKYVSLLLTFINCRVLVVSDSSLLLCYYWWRLECLWSICSGNHERVSNGLLHDVIMIIN